MSNALSENSETVGMDDRKPYRPEFTGEGDSLGPLTEGMARDYRERAEREVLRCLRCSGELTNLRTDYRNDQRVGDCPDHGPTAYSGHIAEQLITDRCAVILRAESPAFGTARRVELGEL